MLARVGRARAALSTLPPAEWTLLEDFVRASDERALCHEAAGLLEHLPWDRGHFDTAIVNYRETLLASLEHAPVLQKLVSSRIQPLFASWGRKMLPVHLLNLAPDGYIKSHIDNPQVQPEATKACQGLTSIRAAIL